MSRGWRKRSPADEGDGGEAWMATYGDMVTLLLAFFVILFSMAEVDLHKFEKLLSGLEVFGNQPVSVLPGDPSVIDQGGDPQGPPPPGVGVEIPDPDQPQIIDEDAAEELQKLREELLQALEFGGYETLVDLQSDARGLVISIATDNVLFAVGSAELSERGKEIISALAPALVHAPNNIVVEGHTDDQPLNRNGYTNWNLSTDRAVAVIHLLDNGHNIDPYRLSAQGFGEHRPRAKNDTPKGRASNRRIELVITARASRNADDAPADDADLATTRPESDTDGTVAENGPTEPAPAPSTP